MKNLTNVSANHVGIVGKLVTLSIHEGTTKNNKPYVSARGTVRVNQEYLGINETSDVPFSMFTMKYNKDGALTSAYDTILGYANLRTIETDGLLEADTVYLNERFTSIHENSYVSKNGNIVDGWQIDARYINKAVDDTQKACFNAEIVLIDMHDELDKDGETTGRLIVRGAMVKYGQAIDVLEFVVDNPQHVNQIQNEWEVNSTINVWGRIRVTTQQYKKPTVMASWGEEAPEVVSTRTVRELVLTGGLTKEDEDACYDIVEIKKAFSQRKADREQMKVVNATKTPAKKLTLGNWEE